MNAHPLEDVRRWLVAEGAGDSAAADAAFRQLFRVVPRHGPAAAFADRVMDAARDLQPIGLGALVGSAWFRPLAALALLMTGLAAFGVLIASPVPDVPVLISFWADAVAGAAVRVSRLLNAGWSVWTICGQVADAAQTVAAAPPVRLALVCGAALAVAVLCGLRGLLSPGEEGIS